MEHFGAFFSFVNSILTNHFCSIFGRFFDHFWNCFESIFEAFSEQFPCSFGADPFEAFFGDFLKRSSSSLGCIFGAFLTVFGGHFCSILWRIGRIGRRLDWKWFAIIFDCDVMCTKCLLAFRVKKAITSLL